VLDGDGDLDALLAEPLGIDPPGAAWTASRRRACRQPSASRVRSTITVTALSVEDTLEGRQMCSSTPIVFTPRTRPGTLMSVSACGLIALQQGVPRDAEMAGDRGHGDVVVPQRIDRPTPPPAP
jgi:hypothetical protein